MLMCNLLVSPGPSYVCVYRHTHTNTDAQIYIHLSTKIQTYIRTYLYLYLFLIMECCCACPTLWLGGLDKIRFMMNDKSKVVEASFSCSPISTVTLM